MNTSVLHTLEQSLIDRKKADPKDSYVASLYQKGLNKILEKVGEEATETLLAAKDHQRHDLSKENDWAKESDLVKETADLWFHSLVMLTHLDVPLDAVLTELEQRMGTSGLAEKANRIT